MDSLSSPLARAATYDATTPTKAEAVAADAAVKAAPEATTQPATATTATTSTDTSTTIQSSGDQSSSESSSSAPQPTIVPGPVQRVRRAETDPGSIQGRKPTYWVRRLGAEGTAQADAENAARNLAPQSKVREILERKAFEDKPGETVGGIDRTPLPPMPNGYTIKITFHKATGLPVADISTWKCDPYIVAELKTDLPVRNKSDPPLQYRTRTIYRDINPVWEESWIVANVPASKFEIKCRLYDEDNPDKDDRLGNATLPIFNLSDNFVTIRHSVKVSKSAMTPIVYVCHPLIARALGRPHDSHLEISVEVLRRTGPQDFVESDQAGARAYTSETMWMRQHFSPMLGMFVGVKDSDKGPDALKPGKIEKGYNFQANEFQLRGPVPTAMYHRYVAYRPLLGLLFKPKTSEYRPLLGVFKPKTIAGYIVSHMLHHQHRRVYNHDSTTRYVRFDPNTQPDDPTRWFLYSVHYGRGGRMFTYVVTLDGVLRFTETGKEFGIDGLSKHALHSDGSPYTAFSGEFFVRRRHRDGAEPESEVEIQPEEALVIEADDGALPRVSLAPTVPRPNHGHADQNPDHDDNFPVLPDINPADYELIIDNESGTYRPNSSLLPALKEYLSRSFPGIHIVTFDGQSQGEILNRLKEKQFHHKEEARKAAGRRYLFAQHRRDSGSDTSSISSSDSDAKIIRRMERIESRNQSIGMPVDKKKKKKDKKTKSGVSPVPEEPVDAVARSA